MKDGKMICAISIEPHGVMVMARWLARKAAIEQLGSQGHKVQYSEPAGTYEATEVYLPEHWAQLVHQAEIVAFDGGTRTRLGIRQAIKLRRSALS